MRKSRAWFPYNQEMITSGFHIQPDGTVMMELESGWTNCHDLIVTESTGLHDKNGNEQFDKDYVIHPSAGHGVIEWVDSGWKVRSLWSGLYYSMSERAEVIGNEFEHPELLKD